MPYLGFESGGTKLVVTLSLDGKTCDLHRTLQRPHDFTAKESLTTLIQTGHKLLEEQRLPLNQLDAVGFGFGGSVNQRENRPTLCIHEIGWDKVDAERDIQESFQAPVYFLNDCFASALAESLIGQQGGFETLFYVTLGTGVGGALVSRGRLFLTAANGNAEVGHIVVDESGAPCPCGSRGCLEAVCSGPGLMRLSQRLYPDLADIHSEPRAVTEGFLRDNWACRNVLNTYTQFLARGLAPVMNLMHPDRIVLGGGLGDFVAYHLGRDLHTRVAELTFPAFRDSINLVPWTLKEGAVSLGAIVYARQQVSTDLRRIR